MIDGWLFALTVLSALGCGLTAGVFFAFSSFVMKGFARLPSAQGVAAMQSVNVAAPTPAFMVALFGTALACVAVVVAALLRWDEPAAGYVVIGGGLYLLGTVGLTIGYHVPRNNALAAVEPDSAAAASHWARYVAGWTAWNHVRTGAALAAAVLLTLALRIG